MDRDEIANRVQKTGSAFKKLRGLHAALPKLEDNLLERLKTEEEEKRGEMSEIRLKRYAKNRIEWTRFSTNQARIIRYYKEAKTDYEVSRDLLSLHQTNVKEDIEERRAFTGT